MGTTAREPEMGLTFEKVWAMFQESDRRMQKMNEELDRRIQKINEETAQQMQETDRKIQEVARQMKATDERFGKLGHRFGELAEHLAAPNIIQKFNALGFHFDDISGLRRIIKDEGSGQKIAEFDILLENGESIIGVEVKSRPSERDVEDHVRRLEILRLNKDKKGDKRKIYGALAGAIMLEGVKTSILKAGLYVVTQTGDTVKIDVPEGFTPKAW
ncbi:MAG: LUC7 domain-containing protein [Synergistaceae bacterium]|jgi:hypothetical protein|nr:LUC7 domain-containing protein [Synergistaceae bacterium]